MGRYEANLVSWSLRIMQILCVLGDPLDGVFGRIVVPSRFCMSLAAEVSAATCLSRDVSHIETLASRPRGPGTEDATS